MDQAAAILLVLSLIVMFSAITASWILYLKCKKAWMRLFVIYALVGALCFLLTGFVTLINVGAAGGYGMSFAAAVGLLACYALALLFEPAALPLILYRIAGMEPRKWEKAALALNPLLSSCLVLGIAVLASPRLTPEEGIRTVLPMSMTVVALVSLAFQCRGIAMLLRKARPDAGVIRFIVLIAVFQVGAALVSAEPLPGRIALGRSAYGLGIHAFAILIFLDILVSSMRKLAKEFRGRGRELRERASIEFALTNREVEIVNLLLMGHSSRIIGEKLFISKKTVDTHVYNIYKKCGVQNRLGLFNLVGAAPESAAADARYSP